MSLTGFVFSLLFFAAPASQAQTSETTPPEPITILDITSYTAGASFAAPTKDGLEMASEEINAAGGVLGRPVKFLHVDDLGRPDKALTKLQQYMLRDKPVLFTGCNFANIELAFSSYAQHYKMLQVSSCTNSDEAMWQEGHGYMFRGTGPLIYSYQKMLAERAASKKRLKWAAVNFNYAWGQSNYAAFKQHLATYQPDAQWVEEQWAPVNQLDAGAVVNAILRSGANAVQTSMFGGDLVAFLRQAKIRGLTDKAIIVADVVGRPEFMEQVKAEMPEGIITYGILPAEYPVTPAMKDFAERYQTKYGQSVRHMGLQSYLTAHTIAEGIRRANSTDTDKIAEALTGMEYDTIFGRLTLRAIDHVPNNGVWIGETAVKDGKAVLVNVEYKDATAYLPTNQYINDLRKNK